MVGYLKRAEVGVSTRVIATGFPVKLINYVQLGLKTVIVGDSVSSCPAPNVWLAGSDAQSFADTLAQALDTSKQVQVSSGADEMQMSAEPYEKVYLATMRQITSRTSREQLS